MSSYSRMIVIPQDEYVQLTAMQQVKQPLANQMYRKELDYQQNVHIKDPHRAVLLQSETIEELKNLKNKMRDSVSTATPLASRAHALSLFNSIEPHLNVNDRGEIITDDNEIISASRYEDLIQYATRRKRRQGYIPPGWSYFLKLLKKHNVPKFALNIETLKELDSNSTAPTSTTATTPKVQPVKMPKNWFKTSPSTSPPPPTKQTRGRDRRRSTPPIAVKGKRKVAPPKKYMFSNY